MVSTEDDFSRKQDARRNIHGATFHDGSQSVHLENGEAKHGT